MELLLPNDCHTPPEICPNPSICRVMYQLYHHFTLKKVLFAISFTFQWSSEMACSCVLLQLPNQLPHLLPILRSIFLGLEVLPGGQWSTVMILGIAGLSVGTYVWQVFDRCRSALNSRIILKGIWKEKRQHFFVAPEIEHTQSIH